MKKRIFFQAFVLLTCVFGLAAIPGCGGGGGGGGTPPPPAPSITTAALPSGAQGQPYSASLSATSGTQPYSWSATGLPAGITLSAAGALSGTPSVQGTFTPNFTVTDANGLTGNKPLSIVINSPNSPIVATAALPSGTQGLPYSASLSATNGTQPYSWSVPPGSLPAGITLSAAGELKGTPSVQGTFTPSFTVTDANGLTGNKPLSIVINSPNSSKTLVLSVADYSTPSGAVNIFDNANVANGASAWTRQLKGNLTTLDNNVGGPPAGVSYDVARKILYVARTQGADNGAVLAFNNADTLNDNVAPSLVIRTSAQGAVVSPSDVFIDSDKDRIYVAGSVNGSSGVIAIANNVSTSPELLKTIDLPSGTPAPAAISVDTARDILYVVPSLGTGFIAYDNVSNPSGGQRTITINSAGVGLVDVKIDPATDTAYAADYNGGRVFVINNVSQKNGTNTTPDRTMTGLSKPNSLFLDVANDRLFVSNLDVGGTSYSVGVVEKMSSVNDFISFSRTLSGFGTAAGMTGYYK